MNTINTLYAPKLNQDYTVALIDSDQTHNDLLADRLRSLGVNVLQAFSSQDITSIILQKPDYIVIDPIYESCDEVALCTYLSDPDAGGIVVYSSNTDPQRREYLFECGILEYFFKEESIEYIANELLRLFATIDNNVHYHVTMISSCDKMREKFAKMILHRGYRSCFLDSIGQLYQKWHEHEHEMPDMLILDLENGENIDEALRLLAFIRIEHLCEIPIMALFDEFHPNLVSRLYREGINEVLAAPYPSEKLLSKATRHLDYRISKKLLGYDQRLSTQLKTMINFSSIVSKTDPNGIITYVNEPFCTVSGYRYEELVGQPHNIIRHPDNSPILFEQMWHTLHEKKIFHGIIMNRRKDGSSYYVDSTISPVMDDNGTIIEYISIRNDVTPLIEKQHEIEEQRRQIQNVLDSQTSLICLVDKIDGVKQSNQGFMDFLGIDNLDPETCGCSFLNDLFLDMEGMFTIKHGERYVWLERLYDRRGTLVKVAMKDKFNNHHVFAIHVEKISDKHYHDHTCYIVSFENITELNRALREAKAASEAESRFLATMSHEIRTPLNGILGFAELLNETPLNKEQKKYLDTITYSGETLRQIINDILEVMKLDREEMELHDESINFIGELESIIYPFYAQAEKKGVELLVFIDPKLPHSIFADMLRVKQIMINLIGNAIKFTPHGKKVYIRIKKLRYKKDTVTVGFSVADEGIGVKEENKAAIFNAFVQADNSIARQYGGTGLGLNIVLRIVGAKGGRLRFKSILGKGSVFHTQLDFKAKDETTFPYECRKTLTNLYLPVDTASKRFELIERYLNRFECCDNVIQRIKLLDTLNDDENLNLVLFMDTMSMGELSTITKRFTKAHLYVIPSFQTDLSAISHMQPNISVIRHELSWSALAKGLDIYRPSNQSNAKTDEIEFFHGLRFLIAEDNEVNQFYIQEILKKLCIEYDLAHDGYEAVKKFINGKYDLVLMDINMPNLDGITATQQILRYEHDIAQPHTPIIGLSADAVASNIAQYIQQGLDGYLIKPLRKSDLTKMLKELFAVHQSCSTVMTDDKEISMSDPTLSDTKNFIADIASKLDLPEEIIAKLFEKFINNANVLIEQLQTSVNDQTSLKTAIHSLKGISKNLYIEPLGSECEQFETDLSSMNDATRSKRLDHLIQELHTIIDQMHREIAQ